MEDHHPRARFSFEGIEHCIGSPFAMHGHHAPARTGTSAEDAIEAAALDVLVGAEFGRSVQAYLAYILRLRKQPFEQGKFTLTLMGYLWMQAECGPDPRCSLRQGKGAAPSPRRRRDGQHVVTLFPSGRHDGMRVRIEVEMAVEIDHTTTLEAAR